MSTKDHKELAKEYRAGKHSFKHPKNAIKLAEMHEHHAKSKALDKAKGKIGDSGNRDMKFSEKPLGSHKR